MRYPFQTITAMMTTLFWYTLLGVTFYDLCMFNENGPNDKRTLTNKKAISSMRNGDDKMIDSLVGISMNTFQLLMVNNIDFLGLNT
jgi:hypothetical protein